jgi:hypothetical protein
MGGQARLQAIAEQIATHIELLPAMTEAVANLKVPQIGSSYRAQRMTHWLIGRNTQSAPTHRIWGKKPARQFANLLDLDVPAIYQECVASGDVHVSQPSVVKPAWENGGVAVLGLVPGSHGLTDVFNKGRVHQSVDALRQHLGERVGSGQVHRDEWIVEELVLPAGGELSAARDLKFFCFYGAVQCVLQVDRWSGPQPIRAIFDIHGKPINASPMYGLPPATVEPKFTAQDIAYAAKLSESIPWPGVRIDFMNGARGLVFGEFTFMPGAYAGFHAPFDQVMGLAWAKGAARLYDDLLGGKEFPAYLQFLRETENMVP